MREIRLIHVLAVLALPLATSAAPFATGDVMVGVASGSYQHRSNSGVLIETLSNGVGGFTTGCAFDQAGNFYGTAFSNGAIDRYDAADPHVRSNFGFGFSSPESIVFDGAGNAYVGSVGGGIRVFAPDGTYVNTILAGSRIDFFDIAADQDTLFYTQEGTGISRVSISSGLPLAPFTSGTAVQAFAVRILPDGGALLADRSSVKRYDRNGVVTRTYGAPGESSWFALNLDPNGTSFWSGNYGSSNYYRFNIETGAIEAGPINTGTGASTLYGICVKGEITAAQPTGHFLTVVPNGAGTGTVSSDVAGISCPTDCSSEFTDGSTVTLTAVAGPTSVLAGWSGCDSVNAARQCVVSVAADRQVVANFQAAYRLTLSYQGTGTGTVSGVTWDSCTASECTVRVQRNSTVTLRAAPTGSNSVFKGWTGCSQVTSDGGCVVPMFADRSATARFEPGAYTMKLSYKGLGTGVVTGTAGGIPIVWQSCGPDPVDAHGTMCLANIANGATVSLTASPATGSFFKGWAVICTGTGGCNFKMNSSKNPWATFSLQ